MFAQARWIALMLIPLLLLVPAGVFAYGYTGYKFGAVYTRSIIPGPNDKPVYVEYNQDGQEVGEIGEAVDELADVQVMAASRYQAYVNDYATLLQNYPELELKTRDEYTAANFTNAEGESLPKPDLADDSAYVALRPADQRLLLNANLIDADRSQLILMELPLDPRVTLDGATVSVLLREDGSIHTESSQNIGFRVGFYGNDADPNKIADRDWEDTIYGPLVGVPVTVGIFGGSTTNDEGKFSVSYVMPPCPGFTFSYTTNTYLELYYKRFNPRANPTFPYYMTRSGYDLCNGLAATPLLGPSLTGISATLAVQAIGASIASPRESPRDFMVDIMVLAGQARLGDLSGGDIPLGDTRYDGSQETLERIVQEEYDFDGDGEADKAILGKLVTETDPDTGEETQRFETVAADDDPEIQGVWLSSAHDLAALNTAETLPDLTRLPDWNADFEDRALLSEISEDDLRDTDIYVFRESDGTLVTERRGLQLSEISQNFFGTDNEANSFYYTIQIVGALEGILNRFGYTHGGEEAFRQWQADGEMNPVFHERKADHLRAGEKVRIVAINRASGYTGSLVTEMKTASGGISQQEISFPLGDLILRPPQLKIWARRISKVEAGLTKDEERDQVIGSEGAGMADDSYIAIHTEWLDENGQQLPAELEDYGFTGRVAQVVSPNVLAPAGGGFESGDSLAQFKIKPGRQIQVVRLPERILGEQHLYVQVNGQPDNRNPDFGSSGAQSGILQHRPDNFVPFQVPVYDEESSLLQIQAYRTAKQAFEDGTLSTEPAKPEPIHRWVYRPEFQFSVYDLTMEAINRTAYDDQVEDVFQVDEPVLASNDKLLELLYELAAPQQDPLTPYSYQGERELIFALGEQEIKATVGDDQTVSFDNLDHLAALEVDDYLLLRLYSNNDAGNILWEWAFSYLAGGPEIAYIDADEAALELIVYAPSVEEDEVELLWSVHGAAGGNLSHTRTTSQIGIFTNKLLTSRKRDDQFHVTARVVRSDSEQLAVGAEITLGPFIVEPGSPSRIEIQSGAAELKADETATTSLNAVIYDAHDNKVADDTAVSWELDYDGELQEVISETTDGEVSVDYLVGDRSDTSTVIVRAGVAEASFAIAKQKLNVNLGASHSVLRSGSADTTTLTVTADGADGTPVSWSSTRGAFISVQEELTGGQATAVLAAARLPGSGFVSVGVGNSTDELEIVHDGSGRTVAGFEHAAIVGAANDGSVTVEGLNGPRIHSYITSTEAIIQGTPGAQLTLTPGGFFTPNALPVLNLAMNGIDIDVDGLRSIPSEVGELTAAIMGDVSLDASTAFTLPGQSMKFEGGHLMLAPKAELDIDDNLFVNLRFRLSTDASGDRTLIRKGDGTTEAWSLKVDSDGHLVAQVTTDVGSYSVRSTQLVETEKWTIAGLRIRNGTLELGLNDERANVAISGTISGAGKGIAVGGVSFQGHIDDVKLGHEVVANALLTFADGSLNNTVTLAADGTARVTVQATGVVAGRGQIIGLSQVGGSAVAQNTGESPQYADLLIDTVSTLLGINTAYANPVAGAQEAGLAITKEAEWGWVVEWVGERLFGDAWDDVKQVSEFIYQLTAVSDIVTLLEAVYNLAKGDTDKIDGFEVTFAAIGIGATALAVMTSGGAALPAFKGGLTAIKPVLRELFATGAKDALKVGVITAKYLFRQIKAFVKNPRMALDEMSNFGTGLKRIVTDTTGKTLTYFFGTIRSMEDFVSWVKSMRYGDTCLSYSPYSAGDTLYAQVGSNGEVFVEKSLATTIRSILADALFGPEAHAAAITCPGFSINQKLIDLANDTARFGSAAKAKAASKTARIAFETLNNAGIVLNSQRSLDVLADIAAERGNSLVKAFVRNATKGFARKDGSYKLTIENGALDTLLDRVGNIPPDVSGYDKWIAGLAGDSLAIKGIAGEADAVAKVNVKYAGRAPVLEKIHDKVDEFENLEGGRVSRNQHGIDSEYSLNDGTKLFVESKVVSGGTRLTDEQNYVKLERQFFKHLLTKILPLVEEGRDAGTLVFRGGGNAPILDYHLAGTWFTPSRKSEMLKRFDKITKDPRLKDIFKAEPKFEFNIENITDGELLPSIIN